MRAFAAAFLLALVALPAAARDAPLSKEDVAWLDRVTFCGDSATVAGYRELCRRRFLDEQLHPKRACLPADVGVQNDGFAVMKTPASTLVAQVRERYRDIKDMPDGDAKQEARKAMQKQGNGYAQEAKARELLHA